MQIFTAHTFQYMVCWVFLVDKKAFVHKTFPSAPWPFLVLKLLQLRPCLWNAALHSTNHPPLGSLPCLPHALGHAGFLFLLSCPPSFGKFLPLSVAENATLTATPRWKIWHYQWELFTVVEVQPHFVDTFNLVGPVLVGTRALLVLTPPARVLHFCSVSSLISGA